MMHTRFNIINQDFSEQRLKLLLERLADNLELIYLYYPEFEINHFNQKIV